MWKYNRTFINNEGYKCVANSKHIMKYCRYKAIKKYGKKALKGMVVHHKDFNNTNDSIYNLLVCTIKQHNLIHKENI